MSARFSPVRVSNCKVILILNQARAAVENGEARKWHGMAAWRLLRLMSKVRPKQRRQRPLNDRRHLAPPVAAAKAARGRVKLIPGSSPSTARRMLLQTTR